MNAATRAGALASGLIACVLLASGMQGPVRQDEMQSRLQELASRPASLPWLDSRPGFAFPVPGGPLPPREDLIQKFPATNPLEGVWELVRIIRSRGENTVSVRGYVVFTRQYMSLNLYQAIASRVFPALQSGFRTYRVIGNEIHSNALMGFRNDASGNLALEATGLEERRKYLLMGLTLRIYQDGENYLEFRRIE